MAEIMETVFYISVLRVYNKTIEREETRDTPRIYRQKEETEMKLIEKIKMFLKAYYGTFSK